MDEKDYWRSEKVAFLALCQLKGIGYWTLRKWSDAGLSFKDVLRDPVRYGFEKSVSSISPDSLVPSFNDALNNVWASGLSLARQLASINAMLVFRDEPDFPVRLREINDPPAWLFVQGKIDNLYGPTVGIVGTREPTPQGIFLTRMAVASLYGIEISTVSGLALGIDQAAHVESLNSRIPTIAVLGTGILENYPKNSQALRSTILSNGGTVVTEYLPYQSHSAENFVRRNRIQAALSDVLIPVEWKIKSGTAHTVRYAKAYGKRVFSVSLPYQDNRTPESAFIIDECHGALFVLPNQSDVMCHIIGTLSESSISEPADVPAPEHVLVEYEVSSSADVTVVEKPGEVDDQTEVEKSGQLPLI
ncbi:MULTISPECIES: DNA-processing protein DprA [Pseudomonas]|uniref:DNA-processing protein DprA n=1 Tax=Pseudomonas TaxID=286 RepID=UPI000AEAF237|nr:MULTISPECIES: DNA-processing protein DprA [Pseudomonas]